MLRSQPALFKFCLCALFSTCAAGTVCAASAADELADCLYANKGLEKTLTSLAGKLVQAEVEKRTSPLLSMTITDLLKR